MGGGLCRSRIKFGKSVTFPKSHDILKSMSNNTVTLTASRELLERALDLEEVRADELLLGDFLLLEWWDGTRRLVEVLSLALLNCDVEWNGTTTTSRSNTVERLAR